jgi:hypothetical protein
VLPAAPTAVTWRSDPAGTLTGVSPSVVMVVVVTVGVKTGEAPATGAGSRATETVATPTTRLAAMSRSPTHI